MATAEAQVKPEELLAELRKQGASNAEAISEIKKSPEAITKRLDEPDFSGLRAANDSTVSYWQSGESKQYKLNRAKNYPIDVRRLPKSASTGTLRICFSRRQSRLDSLGYLSRRDGPGHLEGTP